MAVFSTGGILRYVVDYIEQNQLSASVFSFPFIKPINRETLLEILKSFKKIITIEEHQLSGGFGSAILEMINDFCEEKKLITPPLLKRIAIPDKFYSISGSPEYLRKLAGLELKKEFFS